MESVFIFAYKFVNELEDIRVCTSYEAGIKLLAKHKQSHQLLEYKVIDGVTESRPVFAYFYENDVLVLKQCTK